MTMINPAHVAAQPRVLSGLGRLAHAIAVFPAAFTASVRVARAVEASAQPDAEDLRELGISNPVPWRYI